MVFATVSPQWLNLILRDGVRNIHRRDAEGEKQMMNDE
jgi:hypothetical protein